MKKIVKVKPFGIRKVTDNVLKSVEANLDTTKGLEEAVKEYVKSIKQGESGQFIGINPTTKEFFTFIPIVEGNQFFVSLFPDPVQLYFSLAYSNYEFAEHTRENIVFQNKQKGPMNWVNDYLYNWHLKYKISAIIFLHSTVEAFINYSMPEDFIYKQEIEGDKSKKFSRQIQEFTKEQIERHIQFKEKLNEVLTQFSGIELQKNHQKVYDKLLNLNDLRNELMHLRSVKDQKNLHYFHKAFDKVMNVELLPHVENVMDFLNLISPDFISLIDVGEKKYDGIAVFKFEHYKAFKLDISIFLKLLEVKAELVTFTMPVSEEEEDYHLFRNWIMQNLDVMAKEQWIYFPVIEDDGKTLTIKITKNKNKISALELKKLNRSSKVRRKMV